MNFQNAINNILQPKFIDGSFRQAVVTYSNGERQGFNATRNGRKHKAADINYQGFGQTGINRKHPEVGSPVSGTITDIKKEWGMIEVKDAQGYRHRIWHLNSINVKKDTPVYAGQYIGDMGGRGPNGAKQYDQHVHYEVITQPEIKNGVVVNKGDFIDPEAFWNSRLYYELNAGRLNHVPLEPASLLDQATQDLLNSLSQGLNIIGSNETLKREGNHVWRIKPNGSTRGYFLSE
ncbi:MAG: M23 family metallopeptidase [Deltaproteobacteria bacterium]|nr:M23 family metallopeptidase [Deltaproteobacteria bacterium]